MTKEEHFLINDLSVGRSNSGHTSSSHIWDAALEAVEGNKTENPLLILYTSSIAAQ